MGANVKMAETMGATSKVMADMNKMMNPQQVIIIIIFIIATSNASRYVYTKDDKPPTGDEDVSLIGYWIFENCMYFF